MKFPNEGLCSMHVIPATVTADSQNLSGTEQTNTNECDDAFLVISITKGTTGVTDVAVHTSDLSSFTEATTNVCTLTQDVANSTGATTITSNSIVAIATTGVYVYEVHGLNKYINIEWDGDDANSYVSMVLLGIHPMQAPKTAARSVYS